MADLTQREREAQHLIEQLRSDIEGAYAALVFGNADALRLAAEQAGEHAHELAGLAELAERIQGER